MAFDFFKKQARKQANIVNSAIQGVNRRMATKGPGSGNPAAIKPFPGFQPPSQPKSRALPTTPNLQGPPLNNAEPRTNSPAQLPGPGPAQVPAVTPREPRPIAQPATPVPPATPAPVAAPAGPAEPMQKPLAPQTTTPISPAAQAQAQQSPALIEGVQQIQQAQARGDMAQIRQLAGQMLQGGVNPEQLAGYFRQLGIGREVIDRFLRPRFG